MNFQPIALLDVTQFQGYLFTKYRDRWRALDREPGWGDASVILLRAPANTALDAWQLDADHVDDPVLAEWKSAKALLNRVRNAASGALGGKPADLGKALIVSLKPGGHIPWHLDEGEYAERHTRFHLAISSNPAAWLLSGADRWQPGVGGLVWVNHRVLHSEVNFGDFPRIHLVVDVRKPDE